MYIHVVRDGETIASIAARAGTTPERVIALSSPPNPNQLVPGQTLLLPSPPPANRRSIEVNAYLEPQGTGRDSSIITSVAESLTYLSVFSFQAQADGTIVEAKDTIALEACRTHGLAPLLVLTNFAQGTFQADVAHAITNDESIRSRLISRVIALMTSRGYRGLTVDFEHLYPSDREPYNQFLRQLRTECDAHGLLLSTALAPKTSATQIGQWYEAHDYAAHGQIVDFTVLMTYEYGWSGGPPMTTYLIQI